jgi:O-antigen/teichoic acid export membrane protein
MRVATKIAQHFIWRGLYLASAFAINLLLARMLGADDSGHFYLIINNLSLVILIAGFSLESAIVYAGASNKVSPAKMATLSLAWSAGIFVASGAVLYYMLYDIINWTQIGFLSLYLFSFLIINNFTALFQARHDFKTYNVLLLIPNLVYLALLILLFISPASLGNLPDDKEQLVAGYFLLVFLQAACLLIGYVQKFNHRSWQLVGKTEFVLLIRYASVAWGANLVFFLVYRVDYWLVDYYVSDAALGNYIQVSKLVQLFITVPGLLASVIFPTTVTNDPIQMRANLAKASRIVLSGYVVVLLILAAVGRYLFPWLYGETFTLMYDSFLLYIPGILAISAQALLAAWFAGRNMVRHNIYGALIALVIIFVLDVLFLSNNFGAPGAALASSIAYTAYFLYQYVVFTKDSHLRVKDFVVVNKSDFRWAIDLFNKTVRP